MSPSLQQFLYYVKFQASGALQNFTCNKHTQISHKNTTYVNQRLVHDFFNQRQILFLGGRNIFFSEAELGLKGGEKKIMFNRQEGAEYFIIIKEKLVLVSAPYSPHANIYHQRQKHTILNINMDIFTAHIYRPCDFFLRGIYPLCPTA